MNDDLISRSALERELLEKGFYPAIVRAAIEKAPAVDAEPVKHGHWKYKTRHFGGFEERTGINENGESVTVTIDNRWEEDIPYCSLCGKFTEEIPDPSYCPHCGAKMDEEAT